MTVNKYQQIAELKPLYELENNMSEIKARRDAIKQELQTMTREEMVDELAAFREVGPKVLDMMAQLDAFKVLANNAPELEQAIEVMVQKYTGTIAMQTRQIEEMTNFIEQLKDDPLGLSRVEKKTKVTIQ